MSEIKLPVRYKEDVMMIFDAEDQFVADFRLGFGHEQIVRLLNERATVEADALRLRFWLEKATAFQLVEDEYFDANSPRPVEIVRRRQIDGPDKWVVKMHEWVLDKSGEWTYEPMPSSRTEDFMLSTRFDTKEDALTAFEALTSEVKAK